MSSEISIKVEGLSKCYQMYDKPIHRLCQMLMQGRKQFYREFWALRDVSFTINKGETVGIIGRNGSGKSTLLQLICGTLSPSAGQVEARGRIAALLELGSGFNPEFSGRENVYMNASILGLGHDEIDAKFNSIAAFADIGEFINQPVKTYSSGMMVRLSFAVAVAVDPEILIVDEALSVGDELFQRKCFARIEAIREAGATILFVSHSGAAVIQLCDRAILLDRGEMLASGRPKQIYGFYQKLLYAPPEKSDEVRAKVIEGLAQEQSSETDLVNSDETDQLAKDDRDGESYDPDLQPVTPDVSDETDLVSKDDRGGESHDPDLQPVTPVVSDETDQVSNDDRGEESYDPYLQPITTIGYEQRGACIKSPQILTGDGRQVNNLLCGKRYIYRYHVDFLDDAEHVRFGMLIKTISGVELGGVVSSPSVSGSIPNVSAGQTYVVDIEFRCSLNPGVYFLNAGVLGVVQGDEIYLHRLIDFATFRVQPEAGRLSTAIIDFECNVNHCVVISEP